MSLSLSLSLLLVLHEISSIIYRVVKKADIRETVWVFAFFRPPCSWPLSSRPHRSSGTACHSLHIWLFLLNSVASYGALGYMPPSTSNNFIFTALHAMQTRSSDENSVRLSVTRVICDKMEERSVQIYIPYERTFIPLFWEEEWLVGGDPFYVKFWVNRPPLEKNRRFSTNNRS